MNLIDDIRIEKLEKRTRGYLAELKDAQDRIAELELRVFTLDRTVERNLQIIKSLK